MGHQQKKEIYNGKYKILYEGPAKNTILIHFKDHTPYFPGSGIINNKCSEILMNKIALAGISTHFIKRMNMREQLVRRLTPLPFFMCLNQVAIGKFAKQFDLDQGMCFEEPMIDLIYKNQQNESVRISEHNAMSFGWITRDEIEKLYCTASRIYDILLGFFSFVNLKLAQLYLKFGFNETENLVLMNEITPETCVWIDTSDQKILHANSSRSSVYDLISKRLNLFPKNF